jgi:DNA-binding NarL/FixJ family response regulator
MDERAMPKSTPVRVVVVEDHPLMRDAIVAAIETEADLCVVDQAADGITAVAAVLRSQPDVVIMDLFLPGQGGIAAIAEIKAKLPDVQILALTSATDEVVFLAALRAGATGYLIKDSHRSDLVEAVRQVARGDAAMSAHMSTTLVRHTAAGHLLPEALTPREREILHMVGAGAGNQEIAEQLVISETTVRSHINRLQQKTGMENRTQLALYAVRIGLSE